MSIDQLDDGVICQEHLEVSCWMCEEEGKESALYWEPAEQDDEWQILKCRCGQSAITIMRPKPTESETR